MHIMTLSLVQEENWSSPVLDKTQDGAKGHTELICERHKSLSSLKQSILVHVIDGFVIEESNLPFKVSVTIAFLCFACWDDAITS